MKKVILVLVFLSMCNVAFARIKYIPTYIKSDGNWVEGHFRDVSNDGYEYNNANYLGIN